MADQLDITAALQTSPQIGNPSGVATLTIPIELQLSIINKSIQQFDLTSDSPQNVDLTMFPNGAQVLQVQTVGGKVTAGVTTEKGVSNVPIDPLYLQVDQSGSISAITLTREPGQETNVYVFLAATQ